MSDTNNPREATHDSRRGFLSRALASVTLSRFFARRAAEAQTSGRACLVQCFDNPLKPGVNCGLELVNPPEIASGSDGMLHAILRVHREDRSVPSLDTTTTPPRAGCQILPLRAMEGYKGLKMVESARVTTPGKAAPGPTFRAAVGDTVQIALLNHIGPTDFPATTDITNPNAKGCDVVVRQDGSLVYPAGDTAPNCFHAANTMNIHFHGSHVTPECWGDNVLVSVYPDPKSTAEECEPIFAICKDTSCPKDWGPHGKAPDAKRYQAFVAWKKKAFSQLAKLSPMLETANEENEEYGEWPQYWPGYYPNCLSIPKWTPNGKFAMGQAPGTHWYHPHQHGSTTIHMLNGLAGAFIITGDYDDVLLRTMPKVQQKVLVMQQFQTQPNLERGSGQLQYLNVNGQLHPVITMKPGEVQWWRLLNATVQANAVNQFAFMTQAAYTQAYNTAVANQTFFILPPDLGSPIPKFRQTAQDGVQYAWENYERQIGHEPTKFVLAPANRADILVQAPMQPGISVLAFGASPNSPNPIKRVAAANANIIAYVNVVEDSSGDYNKKWPSVQNEYPELPGFLADITSWNGDKTLVFDMPGPGSTPTIDKRVFSDHRVDQCVLLGDVVEWTLQNNSPISHPFHIHVNPFQVVQVFDATNMTTPLDLPRPWIWHDTFALPPANGSTASFVKIRTRFADFPGMFVLHCHILAHEDRGMMQLVEVRDTWTPVTHGPHTM